MNKISYKEGGKRFSFVTCLSFNDYSGQQLAFKVYLALVQDERTRISSNEIASNLTSQEEATMSEREIAEWGMATDIVFTDVDNKKTLRMDQKSDIWGRFTIERF